MDKELQDKVYAQIKGHTEMIDTDYKCPKCGSVIRGQDDIACLQGTHMVRCKCGYCNETWMS